MTGRADGSAFATVQIIADGPFGRATADCLSGLLAIAGHRAGVGHTPLGERLAGFITDGDFCVRASWRDVRSEFDEFATATCLAQRPWIPVALAHPHVRVGPMVVPGVAPCYFCYAARSRQHGGAAATLKDELDRAATRDPMLAVTGYPPHAAAIAAGLAMVMLRTARGGNWPGRVGQVTLIDYNTDAIGSWQVTPVHNCAGCDRASSHEASATARSGRSRRLAELVTGRTAGDPE
jgi:bacteriocin biosynthesis cyclodehydratase domain-containing protein